MSPAARIGLLGWMCGCACACACGAASGSVVALGLGASSAYDPGTLAAPLDGARFELVSWGLRVGYNMYSREVTYSGWNSLGVRKETLSRTFPR